MSFIAQGLTAGAKKGVKSIAAGTSQADLGIQSPHLPNAIDRIGRFLFGATLTWIGVSWYSGYVNQRTPQGGGPKLILPGTHPVLSPSPDRPDPVLSTLFANIGKGKGGTVSPSTQNQPGTTPSTYGTSNAHAGGFLPAGAKFIYDRHDQGRDIQTDANGPIIAPGPGKVIRIASDPNGFGPAYPIVYFTDGRYKGQYIYIGHTAPTLAVGATFKTGDVIARTKNGTNAGNATKPGWAEIGYAPGGNPGPLGQPAPF